MAIVSGVNIPDNKRVETALTSVYGIGPYQAKSILEKAGVFIASSPAKLGDTMLKSMQNINN